MSLEQEEKLLNSLFKDASKGLIITAKNVRKRIQEGLCKAVSKDVA